MNELSVSDLNRQIKSLLESHFSLLFVSGEISNLVIHTSGHIYFSLKDDDSSVRCVLFKGNAQKLKFKLENGQKVILECGLSVYAPRGEYQLMVSSVTPSGKGSLALALEQLKKALRKRLLRQRDKKEPAEISEKSRINYIGHRRRHSRYAKSRRKKVAPDKIYAL